MAVLQSKAAIADVTDDEYDRLMAVNAKAVFLAVRHAARAMRDRGRIINLSSLNTAMPSPGTSATWPAREWSSS